MFILFCNNLLQLARTHSCAPQLLYLRYLFYFLFLTFLAQFGSLVYCFYCTIGAFVATYA